MASRLCSTTSAHPGQRPISSSPRRCWPMANRHGLGRGLGALLSSPPESGPATSISELPIESISPNPRQPRKDFNDKGLHDLAASFRQTGVLQPVVVRRRGTGYELIVGERRWRAARLAGVTHIPALVRESTDAHR